MSDERVAAILSVLDRVEAHLLRDGDPFCGDDWQLMQDVRACRGHARSLAGEAELYSRGYAAIGACDISNYLARCAEAGKVLEG